MEIYQNMFSEDGGNGSMEDHCKSDQFTFNPFPNNGSQRSEASWIRRMVQNLESRYEEPGKCEAEI